MRSQLTVFVAALLVGLSLLALLAAAHALTARRMPRPQPLRRAGWDWFVDGVTLLAIVAMTATGLGSLLARGRLVGWPLLAHAGVAGLFLPALALTALTWARRCRFDQAGGLDGASKAAFWVMLSLGLVTSVSILTAMTPLAGYNAQETLYAVHRYSALGFVLTVLFQCYLAVARRIFAKG